MTPALDGVVYGVTPVSLWCHDDYTEVIRGVILQGHEIVRAHELTPPRGGTPQL